MVHGADGEILHTAQLSDGRFTLRYRNSVYGSLVQERFAVTDDAQIRLVELAAEEVAVLAEYYVLDGAPRQAPAGTAMRWHGTPDEQVVVASLRLAATDLGRRTLLVEGAPDVALWRLVPDTAPGVTLSVEAAR